MIETLFKYPATIKRYRKAPHLNARERFLKQCAKQGYSCSMLRKVAWILLSLADQIDIESDRVTPKDIELAVANRRRFIHPFKKELKSESSHHLFVHIATKWMQSLGYFEPPPREHCSFAFQITDFVRYLDDERGLSPVTISTRCERLNWFFKSLQPNRKTLHAISIADVDAFIEEKGNNGWGRSSLSSMASSLRSFFRYAEGRKWCAPGIADAITSPRLYTLEGLPKGPSWEDVQRLLESTKGDSPVDIRNYAILLLLAVYGLRRGEVARIQLNDLDWVGERILVSRPKQRRVQYYPLAPAVGEAILRYLRKVRPRSIHQTLFLTLTAPIRPLSAIGISPIVRSRLKALGISLPSRGAHCLRHACASHLLASGFTLKQIGDYLGHRYASSTLCYTKVDLTGLREVAELDLGRLL
jgi:site-specific recombinase XerD